MTTTDYNSVYPADYLVDAKARIVNICAEFEHRFGVKPDFIARSPGRVNLIGEHIDYSDYSVLPMALADKDILIAVKVSPRGSTGARLELENTNSKKFTRSVFEFEGGADGVYIDASRHEWGNYFLSGMKGILLELKVAELKTLQCLVDGNVPSGAGVSSSSAFVCCAALATMKAYGGTLSKTELTQVAIKSERYVGVESGGMDQSCSLLGVENSALLISFYPELNVELVPLPKNEADPPVFVIAHTCVVADKRVTAPIHYNLRVVETRLASAVLAKTLLKGDWTGIVTLRSFQEAYIEENGLFSDVTGEEKIKKGLEKMLELIEEVFQQKDGYKIHEIGVLLEMEEKSFYARYMSHFEVQADVFQLYRRAKHVFSEALRVYSFKALCQSQQKNAFEKLGELMNESQESCDKLFDCSCPELNEITAIARKNGALGSRLTGAGWGGCCVSLIPKSKLESFYAALRKEYYEPREMEPIIFHSAPGKGGVILRPLALD